MRKNWNELEDKYIIDNVNKLTWKDMAKQLGCTINTVQNRAIKLGIKVERIKYERWTEEEIDLLKNYADKYVAKTIAKKLNKPYNSVKKRALKEGITLIYKRDIWKKWMIDYLKDNIDKKSIRQIALFIGISECRVKNKCMELNLDYDNKRWTKEEEQILLDNYDKCHYSELQKLLPNKSKGAILSKARSMNLEVNLEIVKYDENIEKYIVENWGKKSINEMARTLKIPRSGIYKYKEKNNLPNIGQKIKWDEERVNKLRELSKTKTRKELAKIFKSTPISISTIAHKYDIKLIDGKKTFTDDMIEELRVIAPEHTLNELSEIFNKSPESIRKILLRIGVSSRKDSLNWWTEEEIALLKKLVSQNVPIYEIMKSIPKTDNSIISKCRNLNLDYIAIPKREWAPNEIDEIKEDAKIMNINELVIKYKRSSYTIKKLLSKYNIKTIGNIDFWSKEDISKLKSLLEEGKTSSEIAIILNRTTVSVEYKIRKECITTNMTRRFWTEEEEKYLEDNWDIHTIPYLCKKLNRTRSAIINKAFKMNLKTQLLHPEALKISEISELFNVNRNVIDTTWMILGLPFKVQKTSESNSYKYVDIQDLFAFLENNQFLYDGKNLEKNILGPEPEWVKEKRKHDYFEGFDGDYIKLEKKKMLQEKKYYLELLKEENTIKKIRK